MMTKLLLATTLTVLTLSAGGCQLCGRPSWGSTPAVAAPSATYGVPGFSSPGEVTPPASAGSCGPGCSSCSTPSLPAFSGPQVYGPQTSQ